MATNVFSKSSILGSDGAIVSLTSHGSRIKFASIAIESIARGSKLPSQIVLWLDDPESLDRLPASLRRLMKRGLDIRLSENFGPHTKYYPFLESAKTFDKPLVIADDDIIYPRLWLEQLEKAHSEDSSIINCHRARRLQVLASGSIQRYDSWDMVDSVEPSFLHFATGVGGVIYPIPMQIWLKAAGRDFQTVCPKQDDIWLHANSLRAGFRTRQIASTPLSLEVVPMTQKTALLSTNITENDVRMRQTYNATDLLKLLAEATRKDPVTL
jgi:hypothetical protein